MDKNAFDAATAKTIIKTVGKGLAYTGGAAVLAGGGAVAGHRFGVRAGAARMGNQMANAFTEANAKENKAIVDSFKAFNRQENSQIANAFYNRGMQAGNRIYQGGVTKSASLEIGDAAFLDELEKLGFSFGALKGLGTGALKAIKPFAGRMVRSFKRLGSGLKSSGKGVMQAYKGAPGSSLKGSLAQAGSAIKSSPGASLTLASAGSYGVGSRNKTKRTIVEHRSA